MIRRWIVDPERSLVWIFLKSLAVFAAASNACDADLAKASSFLSGTGLLPSDGSFIIGSSPVEVTPEITGYLEISLRNHFTDSLNLPAFAFEIALEGAGIPFTNIDNETTTD